MMTINQHDVNDTKYALLYAELYDKIMCVNSHNKLYFYNVSEFNN